VSGTSNGFDRKAGKKLGGYLENVWALERCIELQYLEQTVVYTLKPGTRCSMPLANGYC